MSIRKSNRRAVRRNRFALLAFWGALLAVFPAMAQDKPSKPRTFSATECSEASLAGGKVMLCQTEKARSATVLRRWTVVEDGSARWVVGFTK